MRRRPLWDKVKKQNIELSLAATSLTTPVAAVAATSGRTCSKDGQEEAPDDPVIADFKSCSFDLLMTVRESCRRATLSIADLSISCNKRSLESSRVKRASEGNAN